MSEADKADKAARPKLAKAKVAPRHTVMLGAPANPRKGEASTLRACGPGASVELPVDEVAWLTSRGFLFDPKVEQPPVAPGPTFSRDDDAITTVTA